MVLTVQQILIDAMGLINTIAIDEVPETSELTLALRTANVMLDRWSAQKLMLRSNITLVVPLVAGKSEYTIGLSGADITSNKIIHIESGYITDNGMDYSMDVVEKSLYDTFEDKNVSLARPEYVGYDPGATQQAVQKGTIFFYYTPDKSYTATLETMVYLTEFLNLSDTVTFEPVYYEALIYNLAVRLFRHFHAATAQVPADIVGIANESRATIMNMNHSPLIAGFDFPGKGTGKYNIYTDEG